MMPILTSITAQETWNLRHQVMWPDQPLDFIKLPQDEKGLHFGLWKDQQLIAVISLFIKGKEGQFRKFATETKEQGKGYGTLLLHHIIEVAKKKQLTKIWCNARVDKANFYERFGLEKTAKRFSKKGINYVVMEKNIDQSAK